MSEKLGIISPAIEALIVKDVKTATPEDLDQKALTKYELVIFAAKRARQINDYYSALQEGSLFNNVGPLVDTTVDEKPLTIAMHEIAGRKLEKHKLED